MPNEPDLIKELEWAEGAVREADDWFPLVINDRLISTLQRAREALTPPDYDVPKTIYLIEEDKGEFVWCEDPDPSGEKCRTFEYRLVDEWVDADDYTPAKEGE